MTNTNNPYAAPDAPLVESSLPHRSIWLSVLATIGQGIVYAICFWAIYVLAYYPVVNSTDDSRPNSAHSQQSAQAEQMRAYQVQMDRTNAMLSESERQQKRMADLLTQQEVQARRWDKILSNWEKNSK
jgi:hypothetical protein